MEIPVPVIYDADILIVGGTLAGCELAVRCRRAGRKVLLTCKGQNLASDLIGQLDLDGFSRSTILDPGASVRENSARMDALLAESGTDFLLETVPVRPLTEAGSRNLAGWIFFGAGGYFAVAAKAVVDATCYELLPFQMRLARRSGALAECDLQWNLLGDPEITSEDIEVTATLPNTASAPGTPFLQCKRRIQIRENDLPAKLDAEARLRADAAGESKVEGAEWLSFSFQKYSWNGIGNGVRQRLYRAEGLDVTELLKNTIPDIPVATAFLPIESRRDAEEETLLWKTRIIRPHNAARVSLDLNALVNTEEECDLLVLGGGVAGTHAALAAAERGIRTLLAEISPETHGATIATLLSKGVRVWIHSRIAGVLMKGRRPTGVLVMAATGETCLLRAKVFIDATGNAAIPAAAGSPTRLPFEEDPVAPGTLVTPRIHPLLSEDENAVGRSGFDPWNDTLALVRKHNGKASAETSARARRRILGETILLPQEAAAGTCPGAIVQCRGRLPELRDTTHPFLWMTDLAGTEIDISLPLKVFLPIRMEGTIVIGQAISVHRDLLAACATPECHAEEGRAAARLAEYAIRTGRPLKSYVAEEETAHTPPAMSTETMRLAKIFCRPDKCRRALQAIYDAENDSQTALLLAFLGDSSGREALAAALKELPPDAPDAAIALPLRALTVIGGAQETILKLLASKKCAENMRFLYDLLLFLQRWPTHNAANLLRSTLDRLCNAPLSQDDRKIIDALRILAAKTLRECDRDDEVANELLQDASKDKNVGRVIAAKTPPRR